MNASQQTLCKAATEQM